MTGSKPIVIGIHGLGNKPTRKLLAKWWKTAIMEGLLRDSGPAPSFGFELAYWADYVYPRPLDRRRKAPDDALFLDEPYLPGKPGLQKPTGRFGGEMIDFLKKKIDQLVLSEEFLQAAPTLTEKIVRKHFMEIEMYFSSDSLPKVNYAAKEVIRTRLAEVLARHRGRKILLIAHSMGSLIAFDVLDLMAGDAGVDTLVTIGSPLGIPYLIEKMKRERHGAASDSHALRTPKAIRRAWFNLSDADDRIGAHFMLADAFQPNCRGVRPLDKLVVNDYSNGREMNAHKSFGYLRCREMSDLLRPRLSAGKSAARLWLETRLSQLRYKTSLI
jgi:hypothetical protein